MSSDEYIDVEQDDDEPTPSGVHVVGISTNEADRNNLEIIAAGSYKHNGNITSPIVITEKSLCLVCGGSANGIHFKALSCAACNAFFRRSVAENRKYICRESGKCNINHKQRCLCRACRLKKCLLVGMDPTSVQPQRDSIGSKKRRVKSPERNGKKITKSIEPIIVEAQPNKKLKEPSPEVISKEPTPVPAIPESEIVEDEEMIIVDDPPPLYPPPDTVIYEYTDNPPKHSSTREYDDGTVVIEWGTVGNLIEEVLGAFQQLQERRRLFYCPRTLRDLLGGTVPTFTKIELAFEKNNINAEAAIITEFVRSIQPFAMLDLETQVCLVRAFCLPMTIIEKYYMTYKQDGHKHNRIYHQNFRYIDLNEVENEAFASEGSSNGYSDTQPISNKTIVAINIPYMKKALNDIVLPMAAIAMTDLEIVGLMLIMLFDPFAPGLHETAKKVIRVVRNKIYEDWFAAYAQHGITNGPEKIGNVVLLTSAIQEFAQLIPQNFHFVRVFGLTDYDEILNDVFFSDK